MTVISQTFGSIATEAEEWYGTKYKTEDIPREKLQRWKDVELSDKLHLPERNEFIPSQFELVERDVGAPSHPLIVRETPLSALWFKQDDEFLLPKSSLNVRFRCPQAYHDPHHVNLTYMFVELMMDDLTEYTYDAELAGLYYGMANSKFGFTMTIR